MTKNELRVLYKQKRKALSDDEVFRFSKGIFNLFIREFKPKSGDKIHLFLTIEKLREINTSFFINYALENEIRVFVPKMKNGKLLSIEIDKNTIFEKNYWGITEPVSNEDSGEKSYDFILTPLLYADEKGNRVGYGKGFYDGFFSEIKSGIKVGVNFFEPSESIDDVWQKDIPLDYLITPNRVLSLMGSEK